jgi:hypothetical protein
MSRVRAVSQQLEMLDVDAEDVLAAMVHIVSIWAQPVVRFPRETMHLLGPARSVCR